MRLFRKLPLDGTNELEERALPGERGVASVARTPSIQNRLSNLLAMSLMTLIGVAFLAWYYARMGARAPRVPSTSIEHTQSEIALPSLGRLEPVVPTDAANAPAAAISAVPVIVEPAPDARMAATSSAAPPRPTTLERRLSGAAFASAVSSMTVGASDRAQDSLTASPQGSEGLATLLKAEPPRIAVARMLPSLRLLLPKGAFIDCTLETAIDSTLPGLTTCVTATDTFSADGTVVLLERGTKLLGETRGQVQQSSARVFVVWTEARTPAGVIVPLDSPGADALGRSGLPGEVERHFWQRFGAAILISTIDGAIQAGVQSAAKGGGAVIYNPSGPQDVMSEVLKSTLGTQPTVAIPNGDRIQVLVARDVDFSRVYELRHASH
jgi:type IV secretion system protein VirB10